MEEVRALGLGDARKRPRRRQSCPGIEALEGRAVPSTFKATDLAKLREAIVAVNYTTGPNTIILQGALSRLAGYTSDPECGQSDDHGQSWQKRDHQHPASRSGERPGFQDQQQQRDHLRHLDDRYRDCAQGGVIDAENTDLTLDKSTITNGAATQAGGGIFAQDGTLNINDCSVVNNLVSGAGNAFGGGIATVNTNVTISGTKVNNNTLSQINNMDPAAGALASGGGFYAQGGTINISHTNLSTNKTSASTSGTTATASGSGFSTVNAVVTVFHSTIENNTLNTIGSQANNVQGSAFSAAGGSLTVTDAVIKGNLPAGNSEFAQVGSPVILQDSTVDGVAMPGKYILGDNGFTPDT